ncbi:serine/threonine-protein phosphatase 4 regulatory subunit 2-like [Hetaerina americana]|uniref:serine/threonine-protein phosphatase 4 regulatory subunit 2-like n=1 Tax=Hetaerina americana TaxID=62018 RepID=UPI003A7F1F46
MANFEELLHKIEECERLRLKELPKELEDFLAIVAKSGDPLYPWPKIKYVYRTKIIHVLNQFYESSPTSETTEEFSYEGMKAKILERFDTFRSAPFTIQRLSELLISPRKEYNRIDKYMRALEKNLLVVSVVEPGCSKHVHLNGSVDSMEEGFQVSSTSVYDDYRQRVAGLMEHEVAAASISEDGSSEIHKNSRCKRVDEDIRGDNGGGDVGKKEEAEEEGEENGPGHIGPGEGAANSQTRINANQGLLDHQEFHRLAFSLAESDTLAIVEIVSEVDCPTAEISEDSSRDYPLGQTMIDNSSGVHETVVGPVISDVDNCDTVTEVVATDTSGSVPLDEDLTSAEKVNQTDKDVDDNLCPIDSPPKGTPPVNPIESSEKLDCQNVDVMDIGGSGDVPLKAESDSVGLPNSSKVLVISSPGESEFSENVNGNGLCSLEGTEKSKDEFIYLGTNKNESASEETCVSVESNDVVNVEHVEPMSVKSPVDGSEVEEELSVGRTSPAMAVSEGEPECYKEEQSTEKETGDS